MGTARFRGWRVVAGVFVFMLVSAGFGFYATSVYLRALVTERGFSVSAVSGATALFFVVAGIAGLGVGRMLARVDVRAIVCLGAVVAATALGLLGQASELWQVYAVYALFAVGFAATALVPGTTIVTRWFHRRRSVALSVASTGISVGGLVLTPVVAAAIDAVGLSRTSAWMAVAWVVVTVPVTLALVRPSPQRYGLGPDGDPPAPPAADGTAAALPGIDYALAVRTRFFVGVTGAYVLLLAAQVGGISHLFNMASERTGPTVAAAVVSVLAGASVIFRLVGGALLLRVSMRRFTIVCMAGQVVGLALLAVASGTTAVMLSAALLGATIGNTLMLQPLLLAEMFGVRDYARIYALSQLVATVGVAAGPSVMGALYDAVGGYGPSYTLAAAVSVGAIGLLWWAGWPSDQSRTSPVRPAGAAR